MSWHAFDVIDDAYKRTVKLLFKPFDWRFYLKLALIVFLISGLSINQGPKFGGEDGGFGSAFHSKSTYIIAGLLFLAIVLLSILLAVVSNVFQFVFIDAVLDKKTRVIAGFKRRLGPGVRLFLFGLGLFVVIALVGVAGGVSIAFAIGSLPTALKIILIALSVTTLLFIIAFTTIVMSFTKDFVAPIMRAKDAGVLEGWRMLLSTVKAHKKQFGVYVLVKSILRLLSGVAGLVVFVMVVVVFLVLLGVPVGILVLLLSAVGVGLSLGALKSLILPLIAVGVIVFFIVMVGFSYIITVVTLPIPVFFRYYSLLFLDKIAPKYHVLGGGRLGGRGHHREEDHDNEKEKHHNKEDEHRGKTERHYGGREYKNDGKGHTQGESHGDIFIE